MRVTDAELEQELLSRSEELLRRDRNPRLGDTLVPEFGQVAHAFILDWLPEQGEELYTVLVPPAVIVTVEVPYAGDNGRIDSRENYYLWKRGRRLGRDLHRVLQIIELWMRKQGYVGQKRG